MQTERHACLMVETTRLGWYSRYTIYELITNDRHFAGIPRWDRNIDMVQSLPEWACNRELESEVTMFRNFLNEWVTTRRSGGDMERCLNAPSQLTCPDLPTPPDYNVPFEMGKISNGGVNWATGPRSRRTAMDKGQYCFCWERPPQRSVLNNDRKLACTS